MSITPERGRSITFHFLNIKGNLDGITREEIDELIQDEHRAQKLDMVPNPIARPYEGQYEVGRRLLRALYHLKKLKEEI